MSPQIWDPEQYQRHAAFVPALGAQVLARLAARPGERVLDLGCGDGKLTLKLVAAGCQVVGIDQSPAQVAAARSRGIDAHVMNAEALCFDQVFDAVFSNAALHWMKDATRVAAGCFRALRPGGRFVGEMGGSGNVAFIRRALVDALDRRGLCGEAYTPWYFPTPEAYQRTLEDAGFRVDSLEHFERPTPLPGDVLAWLETMAQPYADALPAEQRGPYFAEVRASLTPYLQKPDGSWWADYVRLRFVACKPLF